MKIHLEKSHLYMFLAPFPLVQSVFFLAEGKYEWVAACIVAVLGLINLANFEAGEERGEIDHDNDTDPS